jgi:hypothetical protein
MQVFRQAKTTQSAANDCRFEHQSSSHFRARLRAGKNRAKPFSALPQAGPKIVGSASLTHTHALATARQFHGALRAAPCRKCPPIYWDRPPQSVSTVCLRRQSRASAAHASPR